MSGKFPWRRNLEKKSLPAVQRFWIESLNQTLERLKRHSPFYRKKLKNFSLPLHHWEDFEKLPLTEKEELRKQNSAFFAVSAEDFADVFATSGTTGEPVLFPQTARDLIRTADAEFRALSISGVKPSDIVLLHMPIHGNLWGAGISYYMGYQKIGGCVLRTGPANIEYQISLIEKLKPTVLHTNGGLALHLAQKLPESARRRFRLLIVGLDNLLERNLELNDLGQAIQQAYPEARLNPVFGITETASPWHACPESNAYHITPQFSAVEIVDPESKKPVPSGKEGILVITPLFVEGLPLVRYVTNDIASLLPGPCSCGHTLLLSPIVGRVDQQIKIKGVTLYPQAIERILQKEKGIADYYIEVRKGKSGLDKINIYLLSKHRTFQKLQQKIQQKLAIKPEIRRASPGLFQKKVFSSSKPKRFFDLRKNQSAIPQEAKQGP